MIQHMFLNSRVLPSREHADAPEGRVEDELSLSQSFTAAVVRKIAPFSNRSNSGLGSGLAEQASTEGRLGSPKSSYQVS